MNKKGQALVLFIILIPVFLVLTAIFADMGINAYNENRFKNITEDVLERLLDNEELSNINNENKDKIVKDLEKSACMLYDANEIGCEYLTIQIEDGKINLFNTYEHYSFMNSLFGRGNGMRQINIEVFAYLKDGEKTIEFKGGSNESK